MEGRTSRRTGPSPSDEIGSARFRSRARQTNVLAFHPFRFRPLSVELPPCRKKDGSIRRNNQGSSRNHFAAIERPSFPPPPLLFCTTVRDLTHSMHLRVRIRPLNPRTWCIRLTTHSGSQNVSLELSTARPRTFRGVYGITRDTMNNSDNEIYMCVYIYIWYLEFLLTRWNFSSFSSLKISEERIGSGLSEVWISWNGEMSDIYKVICF